jgi:hypothetical protein
MMGPLAGILVAAVKSKNSTPCMYQGKGGLPLDIVQMRHCFLDLMLKGPLLIMLNGCLLFE